MINSLLKLLFYFFFIVKFLIQMIVFNKTFGKKEHSTQEENKNEIL